MDRFARAKEKRGVYRQREKTQGAHLIKALLAHHQRSFRRPLVEVRKLRRRARWALNAHNPYSRALWFTALARELSRQLEGDPHFIQLYRPIYFVTIIGREQQLDPDLDPEELVPGEKPNPSWGHMLFVYSRFLSQFDCVGMLDVGMYVSARRVLGRDRVFSVHAHALVWNTSEAALDRLCTSVRSQIRSSLTYATPISYELINPADFLQLVWYISKMPRKQHQLHRNPTTGRLRQFKRAINGVNAVRLYALMADLTLDQLTFAQGEGLKVLAGVRQRLRHLKKAQ